MKQQFQLQTHGVWKAIVTAKRGDTTQSHRIQKASVTAKKDETTQTRYMQYHCDCKERWPNTKLTQYLMSVWQQGKITQHKLTEY